MCRFGWNRFTECESESVMSLAKPVGFAWTVAVLGRGSASLAKTVRRAVIVQISPTESAPSALLETGSALGGASGYPSRVAVPLKVISTGESAEPVLLTTHLD